MTKLTVLNTAISWYSHRGDDFISLTGMARYQDTERVDYIIQTWNEG
ncbi:hypothetical protein [Desulfovibrio sp. ZJ200]|nr:hypothetical protein [Desulfovibrio sp. ZJ200]